MNQLLPDTSYCACGTGQLNHPILKITAGNDFSILIQITEKVDGDWVHYDMTDMLNVQVSVNSPNNTPNDIEHIIDEDGNIVAIVDAQQYRSYVPYAIEVVWQDKQDEDTIDHRAYAPAVFMFVNSSMEATDSSYDYTSDNPYEYNIRMLNDLAILSIGHIPDVDLSYYYTKNEIDETLLAYVTHDYLSSQSYVEQAHLYDDIYSKEEVDSSLASYVTYNYLSAQAYLTSADLTGYATNNSVDNKIQLLWSDAVTTFIDDNELASSLSSYTTYTYISSNYPTYTYLNTNYTTYAYLDSRLANIPIDIPTNVVTSYDGTYIYCLTQQEYDTLEQAQQLDPDTFYYISDATSNYVTTSTLGSYVSKTELNNMGYITINDVPAPDLSNYYTKGQVDNTLTAYVKTADLNTTLDSYVKQTSLDTTLSSYTTYAYISSNYPTYTYLDTNYPTYTYLNTNYPTYTYLNTNYVTYAYLDYRLDGLSPGGTVDLSSYVTYTYWDNSNEAIAYFITNQTLFNNDIGNNYYNKSDINTILTSYASQSDINAALGDYVTTYTNEQQNEVIAYAISYLNDNTAYTVKSTTITNIWNGSQSDYSQLTPDANTLYIII